MKKIIQKTKHYLPPYLKDVIGRSIPKISTLNTYSAKCIKPIAHLSPIDKKYIIRVVGLSDIEQLKKANQGRGRSAFKRKVLRRIHNPAWKGLAVFDKTTGDIAYIAWVITQNIDYINEFGIHLKPNQFLLKDGYCVPEYRHQGLHTRMEQERINYSIRNGATELFIQIDDNNEKGKKSVLENGYQLYQQNKVLSLSIFSIYRELKSFFKYPFKKVIT